jgi:hypothetical protein
VFEYINLGEVAQIYHSILGILYKDHGIMGISGSSTIVDPLRGSAINWCVPDLP